MPFRFSTPFPEVDPRCVARFSRTFEHVDWIDGESVVQAEPTPTEEGFNARFRKIIADLEALGTDASTATRCTAELRASLFARFDEVESALADLAPGSGGPDAAWTRATMENGWRSKSPDTDHDYYAPGFSVDRGIVRLRGIAGNGPVPSSANRFTSILFTLPTGMRPANRLILHAFTSGSAVARLDIQEDGAVNLRGAYSSWVSLDGISFPTP